MFGFCFNSYCSAVLTSPCRNLILVIHFTLYAGRCLPIWIKGKDQSFAWPYAFDSPEVAILKPEVRGLWHQTNNFRALVEYLQSSTGQRLYPRCKKSGASTMIRMGYHRSLVGGITSRPRLPQTDLAMKLLLDNSSLPGQQCPLNVRIPFQPKLDASCILEELPPDKCFLARHNQRVRKCLRNNQSLTSIVLAP